MRMFGAENDDTGYSETRFHKYVIQENDRYFVQDLSCYLNSCCMTL